ncbi:MAG: hypothetical protein AUK47_22670 [Deltaproteobacteria bacterium CG2_30_63_29]|nr:MAG: hypothetical protein AUK47_22670 [Deltaproteobacteria bacterium CG2_30_63_29]PJB35219.1 MAG: hypothetical protein CO108_26265 [Deltaproteobacteria bacterium CG_4_9_14_3_um_filter_63_12]
MRLFSARLADPPAQMRTWDAHRPDEHVAFEVQSPDAFKRQGGRDSDGTSDDEDQRQKHGLDEPGCDPGRDISFSCCHLGRLDSG